MTTRNQIQAEQAVQGYTRRNARLVFYGALGNNAGTVDHATRNDWVYVRLHGDSNQVVEAYAAASFPHVNNVVVDVEKVMRKGAPYYQIMGVSAGITYATVNNPFAGMPGYHASTHQRRDRNAGGPDPLDIYNRALVNLRARAQATPNMTLYVERGFYVITSFKEWTGGNSAAFTACPILFVRWDLLYLGNDDALHILEGTAVLSTATPVYPTVPANCIPIAYVYRSGNQASLDEADITDARTILSSNQATASAHNLLSAVHGDTLTDTVVDGDTVIGNATPKWSRLAIAIPAANVRNVLGIDNGELRPSWKAGLDSTSPATLAATTAASAGTSLVFAHRDHVHALAGVHHSTSITYISGTGTAGVDNTAQTVKSLTLAANTLTQVGDRMRVRCYWTGDTGSPITGSCKVGPSGSEVLVSHTTDAGAATLQLNEVWLHYIDNTHANIIENEAGALGALSAPNVAGFTWNAAQVIIFTQDAIANNHTILYALIVDVFPKGV